MTAYTQPELRKFDRLTKKLSSLKQMDRIEARFALNKFVAEHGEEKCNTMFKVLKDRDRRRRGPRAFGAAR